jgi:hypothetical protein
MANLMPGDVFPFGTHNYIAVMVNESRCRAIPLDSSIRVVKFGGKEIELRDYSRKLDISPNSLVHILDRRGERGALEFLRSRKASAPESKPDAQTQQNIDDMKTEKSKLRPLVAQKPRASKPRGGLAAELASAKAKLTPAAVEKKTEPKPDKTPKTKPESTEPALSKTKERYEFLKAQFDGSRPKSEIALNLVKFNGLEATETNVRKAKANVNNFPSNPHPDGWKAAWAPEPGKEKPAA